MLLMVLDGKFHKTYERGLLGKVIQNLEEKKLTRRDKNGPIVRNISSSS